MDLRAPWTPSTTLNEPKEISRTRMQSAWVVAVAADFLQIVAFPFFWQGALSPVDDVLDMVVAALLTALLGWHWSFVPSFVAKLVPALDLIPTWSAAVLLARRKTVKAEAEPAGVGVPSGADKHLSGETAAARAEREAAVHHEPAARQP
jgi:hypothetical protein